MTTVGTHGLTCLDGSSYAAIALSMQSNAQALDAALFDISASLAAYGNRFVSKSTTTGSSSVAANSGQGLPDGTAAGTILTRSFGVLPQGWYGASSSMTYQASGAVTAGSYRRGVIIVNLVETKIPPTFYQAITIESGTGTADSMTVNAWFYSDGILATTLTVLFGHGNTGSNMTVAAGTTLTVRFLDQGLVT